MTSRNILTASLATLGLLTIGTTIKVTEAGQTVVVAESPVPTTTTSVPPTTPTTTTTKPALRPATATKPAVRLNPPTTTSTVPTGLWGLPYAPPGLSDCAEMNFYRTQFGLPSQFSDQPRTGPRSRWGFGWRESNCRNEDIVRTWCCHGYWQLYISLFMKDHRMRDRLAKCDVDSASDVNSDTPYDKQRQACAARAAYDVAGLSPWNL
jgi:hypothetical protein